MPRSSSMYERELKQLLQGEPEALRRYASQLPEKERSAVPRVRENPFLVVRAAGSFGFDLVALRREFAFPIEVKSSQGPAIHFTSASGRAAEQLEFHRSAVAKVGLLVLYAYRRIGRRGEDPWRLFTPVAPPGRGRLELIRRRLPVIDTTREGHAVLRWEAGMPLAEFLLLITTLLEPPGGA